MSETQNKSKRDVFGERLKSRYPDREFADDEAMFGQAEEDYAAFEDELGRYKKDEEELTSLLAKDPRVAQFISDIAQGKDPWIAVLERMGIDGVTEMMNDPEKREAYAAANKAYVERIAKGHELDEQYHANFGESMKMLSKMQQERGLSDETIDAAMDLIMNMTNEAILGKFTPETVEMALKAVNHDAEVENARSEGEVAGRNARIDEKLRRSKGGDGMPVMGGTGSTSSAPRKLNIFDYAEAASN